VQVGEAFRELNLFSITGYGPECSLPLLKAAGWKVCVVNGQEPFYAGVLELEVPGGLCRGREMNLLVFNVAENPDKHIEEMNANIRASPPDCSTFPFQETSTLSMLNVRI
jgi:hypothetical protein